MAGGPREQNSVNVYAGTDTEQAIGTLAAEIAEELDIGGPVSALTARLAGILEAALGSNAFVPAFAGHESSVELWRDPQRGFVIQGSIHKPAHVTPAHDHAEAWAVYGMYRGQTGFRLYDRGEDAGPRLARLTLVDERIATPTTVIVVAPGQVHENWNPTNDFSWNIVVRPRPLSDVWRRSFDTATGTYRTMRRPG